jgi:hypothetical protein
VLTNMARRNKQVEGDPRDRNQFPEIRALMEPTEVRAAACRPLSRGMRAFQASHDSGIPHACSELEH